MSISSSFIFISFRAICLGSMIPDLSVQNGRFVYSEWLWIQNIGFLSRCWAARPLKMIFFNLSEFQTPSTQRFFPASLQNVLEMSLKLCSGNKIYWFQIEDYKLKWQFYNSYFTQDRLSFWTIIERLETVHTIYNTFIEN